MKDLIRYSVLTEKNPREIILLRGSGCKWRRCKFCDYHLDFCRDERSNYLLNKTVLGNVTGVFSNLEVINSGSFVDLDADTMRLIKAVVNDKSISTVSFECHWRDRDSISELRHEFRKIGVATRIKIGVESFDYYFRENMLAKGIDERDPAKISNDFDDCCLLAGITGQTADTMIKDIDIALEYFGRVCVNLMTPNTAVLQPDPQVCEEFLKYVMPLYERDSRVDILIKNTDFAVGGRKDA